MGLPYMLETCRAGPGRVSLSVEKTKNFDQVRPPGPVGQNLPNF